MKTISVLLFILFAPVLHGAMIEQNAKGDLRVVGEGRETYSPTGISVSAEALAYQDDWKYAYKQPGVPMHVEGLTNVTFKAIDMFNLERTRTADVALLYDKENKIIKVVKNVFLDQDKILNPILIISILTIILMVVTNLFSKKSWSPVLRLITLCMTVLSVLVATIISWSTAVPAFIALLALLCSVTSFEEYSIIDGIFYIAMIITIWMSYRV